MQSVHRVLTPVFCILSIAAFFLSSLSLAANRQVMGTTYQTTTTTQSASNTQPRYPYTRYKSTVKHYKGEKPLPPPIVKPLFSTSVILKEGPYFGIGAGYDSYKVHENIPFSGANINSTYDVSINGTGLVGQLLAGYGFYYNKILYLGGEVFGNMSAVYQNSNITISDDTDIINYNAKFIVSTGYGASFLPGIRLNDGGLVYLRLGYHIARIQGQESRIINGGSPIVNNTSSWSGGWGYGLGFEEAMVENFSLRGDYVHVDYRTFKASTTSGTQYSPSNNQFMLSLLYHFM